MFELSKLTKAELEAHLEFLRYEYDLARRGIVKGYFATFMAAILGLLMLTLAFVAFLEKGGGFLSGTHIVVIFVTFAISILIYFSFVFGKATKLRAEISETKKIIEMQSGDSTRRG